MENKKNAHDQIQIKYSQTDTGKGTKAIQWREDKSFQQKQSRQTLYPSQKATQKRSQN